mgnify:CR=1 FL=1
MLDDPARAGEPPALPPLGRSIDPEEIAATRAPSSCHLPPAAITGQDIQICGGASLPR